MKSKIVYLNDPIYGASFILQRYGTLQSAIDLYAKNVAIDSWDAQESWRRYAHFGAHRSHKGGYLWFSEKADIPAVAHEAFHATSYIMECLECKLQEDTEEIFAYYIEWLITEVLNKLWHPVKKGRSHGR